MRKIDLDTLRTASSPGGASVMTWVTELRPAAGSHGAVAPARYVVSTKSSDPKSNEKATYSFERRYIDDTVQWTVMLDGKQSQLNRTESAISQAIADGNPVLSLTPRIRVKYETGEYSCLDLPHRFSDGHFRLGTIDGIPSVKHERYVAARNTTPADARPLLEMSPGSLVFGSWDSTRKSHQARYRSCLVGEIIGILAHQPESKQPETTWRGGARTDSVSPSVRLGAEDLKRLRDEQAEELSGKTLSELDKDIAKAKKSGPVSLSRLGLGSLPPTLDMPGLVACRRIIRSQVLTFSALRQLRFGGTREADVACRSLLAAYAINGLVRANAELVLRANCDLVEAGPTVTTLDLRQGEFEDLAPLTIEEADTLLEEAIDSARSVAGIRWEGQELLVEGNPVIERNSGTETEEQS